MGDKLVAGEKSSLGEKMTIHGGWVFFPPPLKNGLNILGSSAGPYYTLYITFNSTASWHTLEPCCEADSQNELDHVPTSLYDCRLWAKMIVFWFFFLEKSALHFRMCHCQILPRFQVQPLFSYPANKLEAEEMYFLQFQVLRGCLSELSVCWLSQSSVIYGVYLDFFFFFHLVSGRKQETIMTVTSGATGVSLLQFVNYSVVCQ